ncbi:PilC/PilY family type IV pilus protein [Endothiovibrio diazotrophicus]
MDQLKKLSLAICAALLAMPPALQAEDSEIFFGGATSGEEVIRPNVLFIMDTSGSMGTTVSGTGKSRMENMKEALHTILDSTSSINVGLMRFHSRDGSNTDGGPILFPVANIDGDACDYEECTENGTGGEVLSQINASADDAEQFTADNAVSLDSGHLELIDDPSLATGEETIERYVLEETDDAEADPNRIYSIDDDDLDVGNYTVLFRFPNVDIPADAPISAAEIELSTYGSHSGSAPNANIRVELPSDGNADPFYSNEYISSRTWWSTSVLWDPIPVLAAGIRVQTPDLSTLVEEAVKSSNHWSAGNALAFHFSDNNNGYQEMASYRVSTASMWDDPAVCPLLRVTYGAGSGLADTRQQVGLRFTDVGVPQGAKVTGAHLEFTASSSTSGAYNLTVRGEASDDAQTYTDTANDIGARTGTGATVSWNNVEEWTAGNSYQSPDLSTIVQEIVNRSTWCGGNAMAFTVSGLDNLNRRIAHSFDGAPELAPILRVTYDQPDGGYAPGEGCIKQTLVSQITTGNDDAEENVSSGSVGLGSSDLELVHDGSTEQVVGLLFQALPIPQGASILESDVTFEIDEQKSGNLSLLISAENSDSANAFSTSSHDLSNRTRTSANVTWTNPDAAAVNATITTPDLSAVIGEVIARPGWNTGNNLALLIEQGSGTDTRTVESFNGEAGAAAKLRVRYQWNMGDQTGPAYTVKQALKRQVDDFVANGNTPIVETLYEAARYFRGEDVYFGKTRGFGPTIDSGESGSSAEHSRLSHPASYTGGSGVVRPAGCTTDNPSSSDCRTEFIDGTPTYKSPISKSCQANYIVLLSDGEPNAMDEATVIESTLGHACSGSSGAKCGVDLAGFLYNQDQRDDLQDTQRVRTYTIGFNISGATFLQDLATAGGGTGAGTDDSGFYEAQNAEDLAAVFHEIFGQILEKNTTYTAPAVSVNSFNRLTHRDELYFALFRPSGDAKWVGNIKRYKLGGTSDDPQIVDVSNQNAIDSNTGFFRAGATSWWSQSPDGDNVGRGGAAEQLGTNRHIYTYTSAAAPSNVNLTTYPLSENNAAITKTLLDIADQDDAYRTNLLKWARGLDVLDIDGDQNTTESRQQMGDPLHSKPRLITYGGTEANPDITLYVTTNEGYLHAINVETGQELFSFVPKELLANLDTFYTNPGGDHIYGLDGPVSTWYLDANHNGRIVDDADNVESGDHVYLYFGMRRGGRNYYALDVSNRAAPLLKWMIQGGSGDFTELGQSWSQPKIGEVMLNGVTKQVLIFGGGYDTNQDSNTLPEDDAIGRAVYMVDAETGQRLWWAGPSGSGADLELSELTSAVPSDITAVDLDLDGYLDRLYFGDMRARIWRVDFDNTGNTGAGNLATGGVFASLGGSTAADNRRFYYPVNAAPINDAGHYFISLAIGSGYRSHPLDQAIHDRFYMVRDEQIGKGPKTWLGYTPITEADLYDATDDVITNGTTAQREAAINSLDAAAGWKIELRKSNGTYEGEKVVSASTTFADVILFNTFKPTRDVTDSCLADVGTATSYAVSAISGSAYFNRDDDPNTLERAKILDYPGLPPEPVPVLTENGVVIVIGPKTPKDLNFAPPTAQKLFWREIQ